MNTPHYLLAAIRQWAIGLVTVGLIGSSLLVTPAASAATPDASQPAPDGLSIAITDGEADVAPGASLNYTVTVTNRGTTPVAGELVISRPAFASFSKVEGSHPEKADAAWNVTIAPGTSERRHAGVVVGHIPAGEFRVTALATLYASADRSRILVRAADANAIQGVLDPAHTVGQSPTKVAASPTDSGFIVVGIIACAVLVTLVLAAIVVRRRRRRGNGRKEEVLHQAESRA